MTSSEKKLLKHSFERMCSVVTQQILKGQELNAIDTIYLISRLYKEVKSKHPYIIGDLNKILESQLNSLLKLSTKKGYLLITEEIEKGLEMYKK